MTIANNSDILTMKIREKPYLKKGEFDMERNWLGEIELEESDKKAIAKKVFDYDKSGLIEFCEQEYKKQGDNEPIDQNITFEEFWKEIDHDLIMEYKEWVDFEEEYKKDFE